MNIFRIVPAFLSCFLIAAHFKRADLIALSALCLLIPMVLIITRPWSVRIVQLVLVLSAIEWIRTAYYLSGVRLDAGQPWLRLVCILGGVTLFTLISAVILQHKKIRKRYYMDKELDLIIR